MRPYKLKTGGLDGRKAVWNFPRYCYVSSFPRVGNRSRLVQVFGPQFHNIWRTVLALETFIFAPRPLVSKRGKASVWKTPRKNVSLCTESSCTRAQAILHYNALNNLYYTFSSQLRLIYQLMYIYLCILKDIKLVF